MKSKSNPTFLQALEDIDAITDETKRVPLLLALAQQQLSDDDAEHDEWIGRSLIQRVRDLKTSIHKRQVMAQLAELLSTAGHDAWVGRMFEELVLAARELPSEQERVEAGLLLSERFLGLDSLPPSLLQATFLKQAAFAALAVSVTNEHSYRERLTRRLRFLQELPSNQAVHPEVWDNLLDASETLGQWEFEYVGQKGESVWKLSPLPTILGLLSRDFNQAEDRVWAEAFFQRLLQRLREISPSPERELAIRELMIGLAQNDAMDTDLLVDWIRQVMDTAAHTQQDPSLIYEGMFLGFLHAESVRNAFQVALRIPNPQLRDRAMARIVQAWLDAGKPEAAAQVLHEIQDGTWRGEWALTLSRHSDVVSNPYACAILLEATTTLPNLAQKIMRQIAEHPAFPVEAREAILEHSPRKPMSRLARQERLAELAVLRPDLSEAVYRKRRRTLLDLYHPDEDESSEDNEATVSAAVDVPHCYGEGVFHTPAGHVQRNHFGVDVAGSRVTAWDDFDDMWTDIAPTVHRQIKDDGSVQVFVLSFPIDIGTQGLIPLEEASADELGIENRNGHPSLFCAAKDKQFPTCCLTVVVGPGEVKPGALPDYDGHSLPCVLYTIYPGEPASPFPTWTKEDIPRLETSTEAALDLLQAGQIEEAKAVLYEAYSKLDGTDEAARFWSRHVLLR